MSGAGRSANREFERRRQLERERSRSRFGYKLAVVVLTPVVTYLAIDYMLAAAGLSHPVTGAIPPIVGGLTLLILLSDWVGLRQTTTAWKLGAEGERRTARDLKTLPPAYEVLHDLGIPASRANIDHLVIGPTGVFTVETKHRTDDIQIRSKAAAGIAEQATYQAAVATRLLGVRVTPLVCLRGATVKGLRWKRPKVAGVCFCTPTNLTRTIRSASPKLSAAEVTDLANLARAAFRAG